MKDWAAILDKAARPTLAAIERDVGRAPAELRPVLAVLSGLLFDPDLSLERLRRGLRLGDRSVWKEAREALGQPVWSYVRAARLETAARLLLQTTLSVADVGWLVGYGSTSTFRSLLASYLGERPTHYRRRVLRRLKRAGTPPRNLDSQEYWERALAGELSDEEARELDDYLAALDPSGSSPPALASNPWILLRKELAAALADALDPLPWPRQRRLVREAVWFPDGTFFEVLSRRAHETDDAARGAELALLAVDALAQNTLLEVDPGAASMAWAWLARARWRAGDLPGAEDALEQSTRDFERTPAEDLEPGEEAERLRITAAFRWFQGRREEALELAELAVPHHRASKSPSLADALVLRAELRASRERFEDALEDLDEARELGDTVPGLRVFELWLLVHVALGDPTRRVNALPEARRWTEELDDEGALRRLRWFEGHCHVQERERRWREARQGFTEAGEELWTARASLDLMRFLLAEGRMAEASTLASEVAATLGALAETSESLAALRALREASAAGEITSAVLEEVGNVLWGMEWDWRGRSSFASAPVRFV